MKVGVIPVCSNGWLISTASTQYQTGFDLNQPVTLRADHYSLDFGLSMIKLGGFGGKTEFLETGQSDRKGEFFQLDGCRVSPKPSADFKVICAGQDIAGMAFLAEYADYNFCFGEGVNTPTAFSLTAQCLIEAGSQCGRQVTSYVLLLIIADDTDSAARAKCDAYKEGANPASAVNFNMGKLAGSYEQVAGMLDEISQVPGTEGLLLTFDDYVEGIEAFGLYIQPLTRSRKHISAAPAHELKQCSTNEVATSGETSS